MRALKRAEEKGQESVTCDLLIELTELRYAQRSQLEEKTLSDFDFHLLVKLGGCLEKRSNFAEALGVYESARAHASRQNDRFGASFFSVRGVRCCVALLDFTSAAKVFGDELTLPAHWDTSENVMSTLEIAVSWTLPSVDVASLHLLRVEAVVNLAGYWAARGRLGAAEQALLQAVALLDKRTSSYVSTPDVLLALAEIRLDRGDFKGVAQLVVSQKTLSPVLMEQWQVLEGQFLHLQGRFSDADRLLNGIARERNFNSMDEIVLSAARQRFHVLCALNRLDEAEAIVQNLAKTRITTEFDSMRRLLNARRAGAELSLNVPPSTREISLAF